MLSIYQAGFYSPLLPESSITPQGQKGIESGQKGSKVNIYLLGFVSPREFRRPKTAKVKYILGLGLSLWLSLWGGGGATGCRWCAPAPSLWVCSVPLPSLCPLSRFPFLLCLSNMPLFSVFRGFLARFGARMYICMGWGLCVDCGAFVCVRG